MLHFSKHDRFVALVYVRVRARSPCCVVSADVTAGTALSRGLVKVGRAAPERDAKDGGQRRDGGSFQPPSAAPKRRAGRDTHTSNAGEGRRDAAGQPTFPRSCRPTFAGDSPGRKRGRDPRLDLSKTERLKLIYGRMSLR